LQRFAPICTRTHRLTSLAPDGQQRFGLQIPDRAVSVVGLPAPLDRAAEHAMAQIGGARGSAVPIGLLSHHERTRLYAESQRQRTMTTWALGQASQAEDFARRQADLRALRGKHALNVGDGARSLTPRPDDRTYPRKTASARG